NDLYASPFGKLRIGAEYALRRSGPMAMAPSQLGIFTHTGPEHETPNIEYHVQPLSLDSFGQPLHRFPALTVSVCNLRPESRGSSHIASADPAVAPEIRPNYLSSEVDRRVAVESIRHARRLMATAALRRFSPEEHLPGSHIEGEEALARAAGDISTAIFHPVSTCRPGEADDCVGGPARRGHGRQGRSLPDASVMPQSTSGDAHAPVTLIAERASDLIRARAYAREGACGPVCCRLQVAQARGKESASS